MPAASWLINLDFKGGTAPGAPPVIATSIAASDGTYWMDRWRLMNKTFAMIVMVFAWTNHS